MQRKMMIKKISLKIANRSAMTTLKTMMMKPLMRKLLQKLTTKKTPPAQTLTCKRYNPLSKKQQLLIHPLLQHQMVRNRTLNNLSPVPPTIKTITGRIVLLWQRNLVQLRSHKKVNPFMLRRSFHPNLRKERSVQPKKKLKKTMKQNQNLVISMTTKIRKRTTRKRPNKMEKPMRKMSKSPRISLILP